MVLRLILLAGLALALWWGLKWLSAAPPAKAKKVLVTGGLGLLVAVGVGLLLTGKLAGLVAIAAGLAPWLARAARLHGLWQSLRGFGRSEPGGLGTDRPPPASGSAMTRDQAYEVLGLQPGATLEEIKVAHRHLMRANHPDSGGSTWIAARLNQARDLLLGP